MNGTADTDETSPADEGGLDPRAAAELLERTSERARRALRAELAAVAAIRAALILIAYGALWLSVRGQHPYRGPSPGVAAAVILVVIAGLALSGSIVARAQAGVSGRTLRRRRAFAGVAVAAYVGIYAIEGALAHAGAGPSISYGLWAAAGPAVVIGPLLAAYAATRENWPLMGAGIGFTLVGAGAAFAGPAAVWGIIAVGGCAVMLCEAAAEQWLRRA